MVKLLKYELIRSKNTLLITLFALLGIEVLFLLGFFLNLESLLGTAVMLMVLAGFGGFIAIVVYGVNRFYTDLKNKHGYMLFLTPRNSYQIVGSKVLHSFLVMLAGFLLYAGMVVLDISLALKAVDGTNMIILFLEAYMARFGWTIWLMLLAFVVSWFNMILTIYFAITLTFTFLSNKKHKGWISAGLYLLLDFCIGMLTSALLSPVMENLFQGLESMETYSYTELINDSMLYSGITMGVQLVIGVVLYFVISFLMEKKLNL